MKEEKSTRRTRKRVEGTGDCSRLSMRVPQVSVERVRVL